MCKEPLQITILHTNDMHGSLEAMSRLSTYAQTLRGELEAQGRRVFFFDAGDAADRRIRFCGVTKGAAFPRLLAAMGYDLQAMGNAISITYGPQAAAHMASRAAYPILAANFFTDQGPLIPHIQATQTYSLSEHLKLGVIGFTPHGPDVYAIFGLHPTHFIDSARYWAQKLRGEGAAPLIVVSHLGIREDRALAAAFPEMDVIIGGHSHTLLPEGETVNGVLIAQTGNYAEGLGRVDLLVDADTGKVLSKTAVVLPVPAGTPLDPNVQAAIQQAEQEAEKFLSIPVAEIQSPLELDHFAECAVGNLAADALRERFNADAAILTSGLFHHGFPAGTLTLGDLDAACFTTANPQLSQLSGDQIVKALEYGLEPDYVSSRPKVFRGTPIGIPMLSGMRVVYDPSAASGSRVRQVWIQDSELQPERMYKVAHTDSEVTKEGFQGGYFDLEPSQIIQIEVPTILREAIEDYLKAHSPVPAPQLGRWSH